jgi:hypothetical protein
MNADTHTAWSLDANENFHCELAVNGKFSSYGVILSVPF